MEEDVINEIVQEFGDKWESVATKNGIEIGPDEFAALADLQLKKRISDDLMDGILSGLYLIHGKNETGEFLYEINPDSPPPF